MRKISLKNGGYFKCPMCGCEDFVQGTVEDYTDCGSRTIATSYTCFDCGYMFLMDDDLMSSKGRANSVLLPLFKELDEAIDLAGPECRKLNSELTEIENKINLLNEELKDQNRTVKRDGEIKEELKQLEQDVNLKKQALRQANYKITSVKERIERALRDSCDNRIRDYYQAEYQKHLAKLN